VRPPEDGSTADRPEPPEEVEEDEDDARRESGEPTRTTTNRPGDEVVHPDAADRSFGRRGDVLLVVLFFALGVAPVVVYFRPPALPWRIRLLLFPLLPSLLLAVVAVWATTRP